MLGLDFIFCASFVGCINNIRFSPNSRTSSVSKTQPPFGAERRPFEISRDRFPHPTLFWAKIVIIILFFKINFAAGIKRGVLCIFFWLILLSLNIYFMSKQALCALTIPETEFSSAIANASIPISAARFAYSSG